MGHYQCEKDIDAYLGLEFDIIGIEEATTLTSRKHNDIVTCNRSSRLWPDGRPWRPRIYTTTNPGGVGHAWYLSQYVAPFRTGSESLTRFVPATVDDNIFTNPGYRNTLDRLTGWQRRAWLDGDWDIAAGQFFTNFRREIHVIDEFRDLSGVEWFAALDYGFHHYTVVLLGCYDNDGNLIVVDEHAARNWLPEQHAPAIVAMLQRHRVYLKAHYSAELQRFVAGADVFARQSNGVSVAEQYADLGIKLRLANTDRINGWAEILKRFGDPARSIPPRLLIHRRCTRLIECLPLLQHDPNRPEDVLKVDVDEDGVGGDDAADCFRYLVASKARIITMEKLRGF
jgi:hypothetical protein